MTLQELKDKIRDLGFDDDATMAEYTDIVNNAITRACKTIALTVKAPVGRLEIDLSHSLGKSDTTITDGDTTNPITVGGESVTAHKFDTVTCTVVSSNGQQNDETFYWDGYAWRTIGFYDLDVLTKDSNGNIMFDSVDRIVTSDASGISSYNDWDMEEDHILVLSSTMTTPLTVFYNQRILPVTQETSEDSQVQVVYQCEPLVSLLSAHYVWLDDDERKAILYWNEYDQLKQEIMARAFKPRAKVIGGIRWHN